MNNIGKIQLVEITQELQHSYLDYAMSVIVSRALPDVRDGLKPVHRRILFAMKDMGLVHQGPFKKCARIVGEVLGKYHPHGDMAVYDSLVRLAQDFSMRYPLIAGQGNFGSVDGDSPAAMRYTEAKLAAITNELLSDLDKDTVDFVPNFDGSQEEPTVMPGKLPNLLLMGSDGIAVGMATKIPPHNLEEVIAAIKLLIKNGKVEKKSPHSLQTPQKPEDIPPQLLIGSFQSDVATEELLEYIKGPDFPTGGAIYNWREIVASYKTGRGKIPVRAITKIEETKNGRFRILVHELPYQVNKANLIAKIAQLAKDKKIKGISDLRDESDRHGMQIVIELKKDARPKAILNNLYVHTQLQTSFPVNMVGLVDGTPQLLTLKVILEEYLKHRQIVVVRKSQYELKQARARAHILEGLIIALDNLDAVINTIRRSADADVAKTSLMKKFKLSQLQATAILDMQLRRLAALERRKIEDEYKLIGELVAYLTDLLTHPEKILKVIDKELDSLVKKYGDARRTRVYKQAIGEFSEEDLIPKKECLIIVTKGGYIKRMDPALYRVQHRGGKGVMGMTTKEEDEIVNLLSATTHDQIYFFTDKGKVYKQKAYELPEGGRLAKGQAVINIINISQDEKVQSILILPTTPTHPAESIILFTKKGEVKKTLLSEFTNIRTSGIIAIRLEPDDQLIKAEMTSGSDQVMIVSRNGKAIRFAEANVRPMGRPAKGVRGILLKKDDFVVTAEVISPRSPQSPQPPQTPHRTRPFKDIFVVTEHGIGKRTPVGDFPLQKRGGIGVKVAKINPKVGKVVCAQLVDETIDEVVLTSRKAQAIRLPLRNIKRLGRNTQGVILMRFTDKSDCVAAVTCLKK